MTAETAAGAPLEITPGALEKLWRSLWSHYQYAEEDRRYAYDHDERYRCKVAAGAAGFSVALVHDLFTPGRGLCTPDCDHVKAGLSTEQLAGLLAEVDRHLARTAVKSTDSWVGADGGTEHAELAWLRKAILAAATPAGG